MAWERPVTGFGILLILVGIAFVLLPLVVKLVPEIEVENIPWFLLYIYRKDGFVFATSPFLILVGLIYFVWAFLHR